MLADLRITLFYLFSFSAGLDRVVCVEKVAGAGRWTVKREGGPVQCGEVGSLLLLHVASGLWDSGSLGVCLCAAREAGGDV
jgi:hypothetical protein